MGSCDVVVLCQNPDIGLLSAANTCSAPSSEHSFSTILCLGLNCTVCRPLARSSPAHQVVYRCIHKVVVVLDHVITSLDTSETSLKKLLILDSNHPMFFYPSLLVPS